MESASSSHDDTKREDLKILNFLLPNLRKQNKMRKGQSHGILFEKIML